jgi:hypothetical protein
MRESFERRSLKNSLEAAVSNKQRRMETKTCCAYNASRNGHLSPKVMIVDRADQPLTILRLIVESLGLKREMSLWLSPLHSVPQLVRPFPFDLVYLDKDVRVVRAVELLPEVQFPTMDICVTSALLLPLHTISKTGTQEGDRLFVCAEDELEQRLGELSRAESTDSTLSKTDEPAGEERAPVDAVMVVDTTQAVDTAQKVDLEKESAPVAPASEPVLASTETPVGPQGVGFTVSLTTRWQIVNSTMAAVAPVTTEAGETEAPAPSDVASATSAEPNETVSVEEPASTSAVQTESAVTEREAQVETQLAEEGTNPLAVSTESALDLSTDDLAEVAESVSAEESPQKSLDAWATDQSPRQVPTFHKAIYDAAPETEPEEAERPNRRSGEAAARQAAVVKKRIPQKKKPRRKKPSPEKPKAEEELGKDHLGIRVIRWLSLDDPQRDRRSSERYLIRGLLAYDAALNKPKAHEVHNVCSAGIYVKMAKCWEPGQLISLALFSEDAREKSSASSVKVQARTVRTDKEGAGLAFVLPDGVKLQPWKRQDAREICESESEYFIREFRLAKTFGFLRRICKPATQQIALTLYEGLSNKRLASTTEIALRAEEMLSRCEDARSLIAHPEVVMGILESGSWADEEWVRHMWAGLLATSCTRDGQDTSNTVFIELLGKMTPNHLKILAFVCRKRAEVVRSGDSVSNLPLYCSGDELIQATGLSDFARIQRTIGHLADYGLLVESTRPSYLDASEKIKTKTTPTALGLKLHARCSGQRV